MRRGLTFAACVAVALTSVAAGARSPGDEVRDRCLDAGVDAATCKLVSQLEGGLARPGVSAGDFTGELDAAIEVADFYFRPRLSIVRNGQRVAFTNGNATGGNPHSISSSDLGGSHPVAPIPLAGFGGGRAFRSGRLLPGTSFFVTIDANALDPDAFVFLPNGDALAGYHCYIHGSAQMSGFLLVQNAAS